MSARTMHHEAELRVDRARAGANRRHYINLLNLAGLGRRGRQHPAPPTADERTDLDMLWRQYRRYRALEHCLVHPRTAPLA